MSYFETDKVAMFPSTYRKRETFSKYTSEKNFVNIINSIVDTKDGYVLSTKSSIQNDREPLRLVLHGYYFEIEDFVLNANTNLYVAIRLKIGPNGPNALVSFDSGAATPESLDASGNFYGLAYSTSPFSFPDNPEYEYYQLHAVKNGEILHRARISSDSIFFEDETDDNQRTVTDLLDSKQNEVKAGNGIKKDSNNNLPNDTVALLDSYNSVLSSMTSSATVGNTSHPVFVDKTGTDTYEVKPITASSGSAVKKETSGSTTYQYTQAALITEGELTMSGVKFFASEGDPVVNLGSPGDFWFKYSDN